MFARTCLNVTLYVHCVSFYMARITYLRPKNSIIPYCGRHLNIMGKHIFRSWQTRWMERGNPDMLGNLELNRGRTLFLELSIDVPRQATASRVTLHQLTYRPHERLYSARGELKHGSNVSNISIPQYLKPHKSTTLRICLKGEPALTSSALQCAYAASCNEHPV